MSEGDSDGWWALDNAHPDLGALAGGVAIVTGGASGIGYALAQASAAHGLNPVIADIDGQAIDTAVAGLDDAATQHGVTVLGQVVDVSSEPSVEALARVIAERFPDRPVSLLACNAGVGAGGGVITARDVDWDFVLGVNVKGVANCLRCFVPGMLEQRAPGSVVMTASQDGLCAAQGVYGVSKHACVALSEALHGEVADRLSVHVLCPNVVATNIVQSGRHRPDRFGGPVNPQSAEAEAAQDRILQRFKSFGMAPSLCADLVFEAIRAGVFYILAEAPEDPGYVRLEAETRMQAILEGGRPVRPRSDFIAKVFDMSGRES